MKKILSILLLLAFLGALASAGLFYWKHLRGAATAFRSPVEKIADLLEPQATSTVTPAENTTGKPLTVPEGYALSVFAKDLGVARVIAFDPNGVLLTSIPANGEVVALPDADHDGKADRKITVASGLNKPHGIAFRAEGSAVKLYIAETNQVAIYDYDTATSKASNKRKLVDLPHDGYNQHFTRTLQFLPDGRLLISIGSSCNVCHEEDDRRAKIFVMNADGSGLKEFARGLRNAVFMTVHPKTRKVWATEMGRDLLGDDIPPDEVNIVEEGKNYGWPNCYGNSIHDGQFDHNTYIRNPCMEPFETPALIDLQAHSAPLGLAFVPDTNRWPKDDRGSLLVAYHGSWNRTKPTGYKIVRFRFDAGGKPLPVEDFITGWLRPNGDVLGRPVAIQADPKGEALYISDDKAGVVYRLAP